MLPKKAAGPITGTIKLDERDDDWSSAASICETAERVFEYVGWPGTKVGIEDIGAGWEKLEVVDAFITDPSTLSSLGFTSEKFDGVAEGVQRRSLYVDHIPFGDHSIAYAAEAQMVASANGSDVSWKSVKLSLLQVRRIQTRERAYDQFIEDSKRQLGEIDLKAIGAFPAG